MPSKENTLHRQSLLLFDINNLQNKVRNIRVYDTLFVTFSGKLHKIYRQYFTLISLHYFSKLYNCSQSPPPYENVCFFLLVLACRRATQGSSSRLFIIFFKKISYLGYCKSRNVCHITFSDASPVLHRNQGPAPAEAGLGTLVRSHILLVQGEAKKFLP